ncbi:lysM and putative peptidoglycan-binding domain-containing protein 2 isoform X1 [Carettochelys insculpta]|uniref:lysM and putative peptidoglycan-binding domain-containing protein 2 isoform X1 n=1 Tax=Carettochelys insculpta TaxID=44489 RepID=UPI003EB9801E
MAEFPPGPLSLREEPPDARSGSESESEAELSQSLARTKIRSYGSTASVAAPLAERYLEHRISAGDTLQGIALKYGVTKFPPLALTGCCNNGSMSSIPALNKSNRAKMKSTTDEMEQIKRANKLFTSDCIFLRKTLNIPVIPEKPLLFNGFNSLESPENEPIDISLCGDRPMTVQEESSSSPSPQEPEKQLAAPEELSAKDFLQRLDLQIKLSKQAARKLKDEGNREEDEKSSYATSSYHQ